MRNEEWWWRRTSYKAPQNICSHFTPKLLTCTLFTGRGSVEGKQSGHKLAFLLNDKTLSFYDCPVGEGNEMIMNIS